MQCRGGINLYAPCILYIGQTYRYSPEYAFYIFSQQIYYLIIFLDFLSPSSFIPPQNVVCFLMLPFLVHKIFTFYINGLLNCKCPGPGPKGYCQRCCNTQFDCTCGITLSLHDESFQNIPKALLQTPSSVIVSVCFCVYWIVSEIRRGRDSSVGIATSYGLDCPGIDSRWGRDFPQSCRPTLGPTQPPVQWVRGVKRPGRGVNHPPHLETRLKQE